MDLLQVWSLLQANEITFEEAAEALGINPTSLKFRVTRWGHRLPLLLATLDRIKKDEITRTEASEVLGVTTRQVNHLMTTWKVDRPVKDYLIERATAKVKWEVRKKFAIDYIAGTLDLDKAAAAAGVSVRQMRHWVSELLIKHFEMPFKDLKEVSMNRRSRLANEVELAEGLEREKLRVADAISAGDRTMKDEAIERVLHRTRKRSNDVR